MPLYSVVDTWVNNNMSPKRRSSIRKMKLESHDPDKSKSGAVGSPPTLFEKGLFEKGLFANIFAPQKKATGEANAAAQCISNQQAVQSAPSKPTQRKVRRSKSVATKSVSTLTRKSE